MRTLLKRLLWVPTNLTNKNEYSQNLFTGLTNNLFLLRYQQRKYIIYSEKQRQHAYTLDKLIYYANWFSRYYVQPHINEKNTLSNSIPALRNFIRTKKVKKKAYRPRGRHGMTSQSLALRKQMGAHKTAGEYVLPGDLIVYQRVFMAKSPFANRFRNFKYYPGVGIRVAPNTSLHATVAGRVKFTHDVNKDRLIANVLPEKYSELNNKNLWRYRLDHVKDLSDNAIVCRLRTKPMEQDYVISGNIPNSTNSTVPGPRADIKSTRGSDHVGEQRYKDPFDFAYSGPIRGRLLKRLLYSESKFALIVENLPNKTPTGQEELSEKSNTRDESKSRFRRQFKFNQSRLMSKPNSLITDLLNENFNNSWNNKILNNDDKVTTEIDITFSGLETAPLADTQPIGKPSKESLKLTKKLNIQPIGFARKLLRKVILKDESYLNRYKGDSFIPPRISKEK